MDLASEPCKTQDSLLQENQQLRTRIADLEAMLRERSGPTRGVSGRVGSWAVGTSLEADERLHLCLEQMLDCLATFSSMRDASGRITDFRYEYVNAAVCRMDGLPPEAHIGRMLLDMMPSMRTNGWFERCCQVVESGEGLEREVVEFEGPVAGRQMPMALEIHVWKLGDGLAVCWRDITARKRAEASLQAANEALRESERKFAQAFALNPACIVLVRMKSGEILDVNDTGLRLMGYRREEVVGGPARVLDIWPTPEARARFIEELQEKGGVRGKELVFVTRSGERVEVQLSSQLINMQGEMVILSTCVDITARKRAEEALKRQSERQALVLEISRDIVAAGSDLEAVIGGVFAKAGAHLKADFGVSYRLEEGRETLILVAGFGVPRRLEGRVRRLRVGQGFCGTVAATGATLVADEKQIAEDERGYLVREMGVQSYICHPLLARNGRLLGTFSMGSRHRGSFSTEDMAFLQTICHLISLAWERTEAQSQLAQAMQRLDAHMENSPLAVIEWGPDMRVTRWSKEAERIFQWKAEDVLGKYLQEFQWLCEGEAGHGGEVPWDLQRFSASRHHRKDGSVVMCHWYNSTVTDEQGHLRSILSQVLDVTEQDQAQRELRKAKATAESASKAKDQFIAVLSHELRTPLTPAVTAVSLLRSDSRLPVDVQEELEMVRRNLDLEVRLIADLLDVSRIISGKLHLEKRRTDVAETIREAARIVAADLDARNQTLRVETPDGPYPAVVDAARLQQVFWNLLRNSIKFSPPGTEIRVHAEVVPVERHQSEAKPCPASGGNCPLPPESEGESRCWGRNLVVEVSDRGSGISPEMLPRLFTAFEQGENGRSFGGLGLGLSICKALVELHGGSISACSPGVDCGATFTVRLPIVQCHALVPDRVSFPEDAGSSLTGRGDREPQALHILLVEDHADTAKLMTRILSAKGHHVVRAEGVQAGLAAAEQGAFDLLISDLGLPDGSGHELMRQLVASGRAVPAIALSGFGTAGDIEQSRAAGFAEHLVKPVDLGVLEATIARVAHSKRER